MNVRRCHLCDMPLISVRFKGSRTWRCSQIARHAPVTQEMRERWHQIGNDKAKLTGPS